MREATVAVQGDFPQRLKPIEVDRFYGATQVAPLQGRRPSDDPSSVERQDGGD